MAKRNLIVISSLAKTAFRMCRASTSSGKTLSGKPVNQNLAALMYFIGTTSSIINST